MQLAKRYADRFPNNYMIGLKYAKALQLNGKYNESIALLKRTNVLPNEGAYEGRAIYRESHLYQAADQLKRKRYAQAIRSVEDSKKWIENLGVGKPYDADIDERLEDFLMAIILEKQGKEAEAASYYRKITEKGIFGRKSVSNELLVAIAMKKLGNMQQADLVADKWLANQSDSKIGQWATAIYKGNTQLATSLLTERYTVEDTRPWEQATGDANFNLISEILQIIK
jgi:tetratricopeptide (TPR) repeat protein